MALYNGTGYFIEEEKLLAITAEQLLTAFPQLKERIILPAYKRIGKTFDASSDTLKDIFEVCGYITDKPIIQYGESVVLAGNFQYFLDESEADPDSGDGALITQLIQSDGYDYAVSNTNETDEKLELIEELLRHFNLITNYTIKETYWFLMPWPQNKE